MNTNTTRRGTGSRATILRVLALVGGMLLVVVATLQHSQSAFSGTTTYGGTQSSATVSLSNTSSGTLDVGNLVPGDTVTRYVTVRYDGTAAGKLSAVKLFGSDAGNGLGDYLNLTVDMGDAGSTAQAFNPAATIKSGTMASVLGGHTDYATAYDTAWAPANPGETRVFRFTVTLPASVGNEAQAKTAKPTINWEVRTLPGGAR